jgi:hypothetical protein
LKRSEENNNIWLAVQFCEILAGGAMFVLQEIDDILALSVCFGHA